MSTLLKVFFSSPVFEDEKPIRLARILPTALITLFGLVVLVYFALMGTSNNLITNLIILAIILIISTLVLDVVVRRLVDTIKHLYHNQQELTKTIKTLQTTKDSLEDQVVARTSGLEVVATLSERLSAILELDELLTELVNQVKKQFDYYHAHIYLLDNRRENLVVAQGTGKAGEAMKAKNHSIPLDAPTSLVARSARSGEIVWIDNVREAEDWLPNPLLPNTHSEMAVPIILEGEVVGILDVQQDRIADLDQGDAHVLRFLANQVAVAIRNARLFADVEEALTEAQSVQERYIVKAWRKGKSSKQKGQHHYSHPNASDIDKLTLIKTKQQALEHDQVTVATEIDQLDLTPILAPVMLRDKPIGAVQIYPFDKKQAWTDDDLIIAEAIIDELAQVAESLRLFDETRKRASREETIRQIATKLQTAPDIEHLLAITTEELGQYFSATHAKLTLGI